MNEKVQKLLNQMVQMTQSIVKEQLTGIYLHGSLALGGFSWEKSDIDVIIVVKTFLTQQQKQDLMKQIEIFTIKGMVPPKGIEMSVVLQQHCKPFCYPTPFELHISNTHFQRYLACPEQFCREMNGLDRDLAAHFTIIKKAGIVLFGESVDNVFGEVPDEYYLDSIRQDICDAKTEIFKCPTYYILNLCRVAAFVQNHLILSKKEGGVWGLEHLPMQYHPLIQSALNDNLENVSKCNKELTLSFCDILLNLILS